MNNLFEPTTAEKIIARLEKVESDTQPQWGKMNAAQMMAHCQVGFEVYFGEKKMKWGLIGMLFGRMAKKKLFSDKPWPQSLPTAKEFIISDRRNLAQEKAKLVNQIRRFTAEGNIKVVPVHPFFGKMTSQEWATLAYKHLDHHLHQFGV
jgi:hypothetical protein